MATTSSSSIDHVSDDALVHILSFLPSTKKRAATSLVSRRWRHLWKDVPSLDLGLADFPDDDYADAVHECLRRFSRNSRPLHRFSADVPFDYNHCPNTYFTLLDSWIRILSTTSLRELSLLSIYSVHRRVHYDPNLSPQLPQSVLSLAPSLRSLKLCGFDLRGIDWAAADTPHRRGFEQLDTLVLSNVEIGDEQVRTLLAACPFIEKLVMGETNLPINLSSSVNPRLKTIYVSIDLEPMEDAKAVIIDLADLEDLVLSGDSMRGLRLSKSPKLREVTLIPYIPYKMPASLSGVEIMSANSGVIDVEYKEQQDFTFPNLKVLRSFGIPRVPAKCGIPEYGSLAIVSFLNRCPSLDTLHVSLGCVGERDSEDMELEKLDVGSTSPCPVKRITTADATGCKRDKALIKYLLGKMACLQCLSIVLIRDRNNSPMCDVQQLLDEVCLFARASPIVNVIVRTMEHHLASLTLNGLNSVEFK